MQNSNFDPRSILLPDIIRQYENARCNNTRFVHYTSLTNGVSILRNQQIWMRNATFMNDYSEVRHGMDRVIHFFGGEQATPMWETLEAIQAGLSNDIRGLFDGWIKDIRRHTYLTCFSEHLDSEDLTGRLSMWRAYGDEAGVALVLNQAAMLSDSNALKAHSLPVQYCTDEELFTRFSMTVDSIKANIDLMKRMNVELIKGYFWEMLYAHCVCLKHPGFSEEREWRVVYRPNQEASDRIEEAIETVDGVPQRIYKIPIEDVPKEGFVGANPNDLINRIIIGPCKHPDAAWDAYVSVLREMNVSELEDRVFLSEIPLRT